MNRRLFTIVFLLGILLTPNRSIAQVLKPKREKTPLILTANRFPTINADSVRVNVFTQIPLDQLVFLALDGKFKSTYELSVFAVNEEDMVCGTRIWWEEVVKSRFEETQSKDQYHIAHTFFVLSPGEYRIVANLVDLDSRQHYKTSQEINITGYSLDRLVISDIMLVMEGESVPGKPDRITPYVGNKVSDQVDSFYVYFAIRKPMEEPSQALLHCTVGVKGDTSAIAFHKTLHLGSALSTHIIPLVISRLKEREYTLTIRVKVDSLEAEQSTSIHITWMGFSHLIEDVDQAIEQARYVASHKQLREMRKASGEAKREAFLAFWRDRDPTPETPRTELMDEYYGRVAYAINNFRGFQPGWETDMGMVYIIYGQPDDIERHPFDMQSKPYQIWFYYGKGLKFVFVDVNMLGDYRLVTPLNPNRTF